MNRSYDFEIRANFKVKFNQTRPRLCYFRPPGRWPGSTFRAFKSAFVASFFFPSVSHSGLCNILLNLKAICNRSLETSYRHATISVVTTAIFSILCQDTHTRPIWRERAAGLSRRGTCYMSGCCTTRRHTCSSPAIGTRGGGGGALPMWHHVLIACMTASRRKRGLLIRAGAACPCPCPPPPAETCKAGSGGCWLSVSCCGRCCNWYECTSLAAVHTLSHYPVAAPGSFMLYKPHLRLSCEITSLLRSKDAKNTRTYCPAVILSRFFCFFLLSAR